MEWSVKLDKGPCRVNHAAVAVENIVYSFGGYVTGEDYTDRNIPIEVFAIDTNTYRWKQLSIDSKKAPFRRYGHSVVAYGTNIYLWGGRNDEHCDDTLYCFDTVGHQWSRPGVSGTLPMASDGHAACINNCIMYIHGGYVERIGQFTLSLHALNLITFEWAEMPTKGDFPLYRDFHTITCHPNGHLLVFGGREVAHATYNGPKEETYPNSLHMYNTQRRTWVKLPNMGDVPEGRRSHSAFVYQGNLYIFAGFNNTLKKHMNDLHSYDLLTLQWRRQQQQQAQQHALSVRPVPRRRQALVMVGSRVLMFGGTHPGTVPRSLPRQHYYEDEDDDKEQLQELDDLWVLDLKPRLETLCLLRVVRLGLPLDGLPHVLRNKAKLVPKVDIRHSGTPVAPYRWS